jgi:hypothetical protein
MANARRWYESPSAGPISSDMFTPIRFGFQARIKSGSCAARAKMS